jgi:hypothetical protein
MERDFEALKAAWARMSALIVESRNKDRETAMEPDDEDDDAWGDLNAPGTYCPIRDMIVDWDLSRMRDDGWDLLLLYDEESE